MDRNLGDLVRLLAKQSCFEGQTSPRLCLDLKGLETSRGRLVSMDNGHLMIDSAGVRLLVAGSIL